MWLPTNNTITNNAIRIHTDRVACAWVFVAVSRCFVRTCEQAPRQKWHEDTECTVWVGESVRKVPILLSVSSFRFIFLPLASNYISWTDFSFIRLKILKGNTFINSPFWQALIPCVAQTKRFGVFGFIRCVWAPSIETMEIACTRVNIMENLLFICHC